MNKAVKNSHLRKQARRVDSLSSGFVAGLAALITLAGPSATTTHSKSVSATKSLRGDFIRIGVDMRSTIDKERRREKARS